ncbi:MAG: MipA/OmpV family protein [Colwellia sp.]|nr:MipA/OmpV family protein [Colwellia sp.]
MTSSKKITKLLMAGLLGLFVSSNVLSADITHTLRNNSEEKATTGNYFELGLGIAAGVGPSLTEDNDGWAAAYLVINGSYNWNGLFIEKYGESGDPILLGYNAYESDNWSLDLVMGPKFGGLHSDEADDKFQLLDDRNSSTMFGGRLTGYLGDNVVQFSLKHDISGNSHGTSASALLGRNWQVRNWNFHGLVGLQFFDSRINDYYVGISENEALRSQYTEYSPGSNINFTAEAGVTYPITENWVFRSTARFRTLSDADMDSPIFETTRSTAMSLGTSLTYVF